MRISRRLRTILLCASVGMAIRGACADNLIIDENFATATGTWDSSTGLWTDNITGVAWASQTGSGSFSDTTGTAPAAPPPVGFAVPATLTAIPGPNILVSGSPNYALADYINPSGTTIAGRINSPSFTVTPGDFYKVTITTLNAGATSNGLNELTFGWAALNQAPLYDLWWVGHPDYARPGELTSDTTSIATSSTYLTQTYYSRAPINAATGYVRIQATHTDVQVQSVNVTHITDKLTVAAWSDSVFAEMKNATNKMPDINYTFSASRFAKLPATFNKLQSGQPLNIVMIGDSLVEDTSNGPFDALLERYFGNGTHINVIQAIGSGTSLQRWYDPANTAGLNLTDNVIKQNPDLVILGGVSNTGLTNSGLSPQVIKDLIDTIRRQVQALPGGHMPEFLLMSGPTFDRTESTELTAALSSSWRPVIPTTDKASYRGQLQNIAAKDENIGFLDMTGVWGQYLRDANANGADLTSLYRDGSLHTGTYGKEVLGRALANYLSGNYYWDSDASGSNGNTTTGTGLGGTGTLTASGGNQWWQTGTTNTSFPGTNAITGATVALDLRGTAGTVTLAGSSSIFYLNQLKFGGSTAGFTLNGDAGNTSKLSFVGDSPAILGAGSGNVTNTINAKLDFASGLTLDGASGTLILGTANQLIGTGAVNVVNNASAEGSTLTIGVSEANFTGGFNVANGSGNNNRRWTRFNANVADSLGTGLSTVSGNALLNYTWGAQRGLTGANTPTAGVIANASGAISLAGTYGSSKDRFTINADGLLVGSAANLHQVKYVSAFSGSPTTPEAIFNPNAIIAFTTPNLDYTASANLPVSLSTNTNATLLFGLGADLGGGSFKLNAGAGTPWKGLSNDGVAQGADTLQRTLAAGTITITSNSGSFPEFTFETSGRNYNPNPADQMFTGGGYGYAQLRLGNGASAPTFVQGGSDKVVARVNRGLLTLDSTNTSYLSSVFSNFAVSNRSVLQTARAGALNNLPVTLDYGALVLAPATATADTTGMLTLQSEGVVGVARDAATHVSTLTLGGLTRNNNGMLLLWTGNGSLGTDEQVKVTGFTAPNPALRKIVSPYILATNPGSNGGTGAADLLSYNSTQGFILPAYDSGFGNGSIPKFTTLQTLTGTIQNVDSMVLTGAAALVDGTINLGVQVDGSQASTAALLFNNLSTYYYANTALNFSTSEAVIAVSGQDVTLTGPVTAAGLTKTGPNRLSLTSSANAITGNVNILNGKLSFCSTTTNGFISDPTKLPIVNIGPSGILDLNLFNSLDNPDPTGLSVTIGGLTGSGQVNMAPGKTLILNTAIDSTFAGIISGGAVNADAGHFTKLGNGKLTLTGAVTLTGSTSFSTGAVKLDFSAAATTSDILSPSSQLTLSGVALNLTGKPGATNNQAVRGLTLNPGASTFTFTQNGATSVSLMLGGITARNVGGTLDFPTTVTNVTTLSPNTIGILGAYATVAGADWATSAATTVSNITWTASSSTTNPSTVTGAMANDTPILFTTAPGGLTASVTYWVVNATGTTYQVSASKGGAAINLSNSGTTGVMVQSPGAITAYPSGSYTTMATTGSDTNNSYANGSVTLGAGARTTNSLKLSNTATGQTLNLNNQTLTLTSGGLLFAGANDETILNGTLKPASGKDLIVHNSTAKTLTISALLADNSTSAFTKAGTGIVKLSGTNNTYLGPTYVNAGTLQTAAPTALGTSIGFKLFQGQTPNGAIVSNSAIVDLAGSTLNRSITLNTGSLINSNTSTAATLGDYSASAGITITNGGTGLPASGLNAALSITGTGGSGAAATITSLGLSPASFTNVTGGTKYVVGDKPTITGGAGTGAQILVTSVDSNGAITGYSLLAAGSAFTGAPTTVQSLHGGTAATLVGPNANNFSVAAITPSAAGSGYTSPLTIATTTGSGLVATALPPVTLIGTANSLGGDGTLTLNANIGGSGGFSKIGLGTLKLPAANTYTGGTTIKNGAIQITTADDRLPTSSLLVLGDTSTTGKLILGDSTAARNQTLAGLTTTGSGGSVVGGGNAGNSTLTLNLPAGVTTFAGILGGTGTNENKLALVKSGPGSLFLTNANTYTGGTTVNNGTLVFAPNARPAGDKLILNASTPVTPTSGGEALLQGQYSPANLTAVRTQLLAAYAGGLWNGTATITSTTATGANAQAIAYASGTDYVRLNGAAGLGAGTTVTNADIVLDYTYAGDATLDGRITMDDYLALDAGYLFGGSTYTQGDFDYSGSITAADYAILDYSTLHWGNVPLAEQMIDLHSTWFGPAYAAAFDTIPEPATFVLLAMSGVTLLRRRRRL